MFPLAILRSVPRDMKYIANIKDGTMQMHSNTLLFGVQPSGVSNSKTLIFSLTLGYIFLITFLNNLDALRSTGSESPVLAADILPDDSFIITNLASEGWVGEEVSCF